MKATILQQIEKLIEVIYSIDKNGIDKAFLELVDSLIPFMEEEGLAGDMEFNTILTELQNAYVKKDLVELADVLNYRLKLFVE